MTEEHLMESIARGDRRAFEELYRIYYRRLTSFVARIAPKSDSADEIIDDTLLVVWKHAGKFRYHSQVSTWIFGIAYRVALKSLRQHKRWLAAIAGGLSATVIDPNRDAEQGDWLSEGLRRLPDEQRLSLLLAYRLGHSIQQVADMTECPVGTVKARLFHARQKMRRHLTALQ